MANFVILLKKNLLEMLRNRRIIIFSLVFVTLSIISSLSARFLPELFNLLLEEMNEMGIGEILAVEGSVADSYVQYISNMGEIAFLLVGLMFVGTIVKEKKSGTYAVLKTHEVKDREIVFSHFVAQIILVTASYILGIAVFVLLNILLFREIMGLRGVVVLFYIYLILLFAICASLLVSCLCKKKNRAYLIAVLGYFALLFLESIPRINKFNPLHLLSVSMNLMYYKDYSLKENLISSISTVLIGAVLVIVSLFVVKNRINNRKEIISEDKPEGI